MLWGFLFFFHECTNNKMILEQNIAQFFISLLSFLLVQFYRWLIAIQSLLQQLQEHPKDLVSLIPMDPKRSTSLI